MVVVVVAVVVVEGWGIYGTVSSVGRPSDLSLYQEVRIRTHGTPLRHSFVTHLQGRKKQPHDERTC